jgi:putative transposase
VLNLSTEAGRNAEGAPKAGKGEKPTRSLKRYLLEKMEVWINGLLEAERDEFLGRGRHEPLDEQHDNDRNGYRPRTIHFFGPGRIALRVPRDRKGEFESGWRPERKGQDPEREAFLAEVFLAGCSTRDWARITEKHLGRRYDSKQIWRMVGRASQDLEAWRLRRLEGRKYKFLYVDGANFAVRINRRVNRQSFCAVLGVSEEGPCFEVLALEMGDRERMDLWESVFRSLLERGLNREAVELGIMDGRPGLESLFKRFFSRARGRSVARNMRKPRSAVRCGRRNGRNSQKT